MFFKARTQKEGVFVYHELNIAPEDARANKAETFAGEGRVLIRPSGTEPLVRVIIEGKDRQIIREEAEKLATLIQDVMF